MEVVTLLTRVRPTLSKHPLQTDQTYDVHRFLQLILVFYLDIF